MKKKLSLLANEEIISEAPGFCKNNPRSGWKPGHLYLTDARLLIWQPAGIIFETPLESIRGISIQQRGFILRSRDALCISYENEKGRGAGQVWIMVGGAETWKSRIFERSLLEINQEAIDKIIRELDAPSQSILLFIWRNRHATIRELAHLYEAPNHMDVLNRIRGIINPIAERVLGCSLLAFERSKKDDETGKIITYSWWITGKIQPKEEFEKPIVDMFDEEDYLSVVMELPGVGAEDVVFKLENEKVTISASSMNKKYHQEIDLPAEVDTEGFRKAFNNNVLEIKLKKAVGAH